MDGGLGGYIRLRGGISHAGFEAGAAQALEKSEWGNTYATTILRDLA